MSTPSGRRINRRGRTNVSDQQIVSRQEKWFDVKSGYTKHDFIPGKSGVPHLDRFASLFELFQLRQCKILFRPNSGTNIPGSITAGIDYRPENDRRVEDVTLLSNNFSGNVYSAHNLNIRIPQATKGISWRPTACSCDPEALQNLFALYINVTSTQEFLGEIWIEYRIAFSTATSPTTGPLSESQAPVALSSYETVNSGSLMNPPSTLNVHATSFEPNIKIMKGTEVVKATRESVTHRTEFSLSKNIPVGHEFSAGSFAEGPEQSTPPSVLFTYDDGTPVPPDTIAPTDKSPLVQFVGPEGVQHGFFASLFVILKPLIRPVVMSILNFFDPASSVNAKPHGVFLGAPSTCTTFAVDGNSATIEIPNSDQRPLTYRITNPFVVSATTQYDNIIADIFLQGIDTYGYNSGYMTGSLEGSGNTGNIKIDIGSDPKYPFSEGDLILAEFRTIYMDAGIPLDTKKCVGSYYSKEKLDLIAKYAVEQTTVGNGQGYVKNAIALTQFNNRTVNTNGANGVSMLFQITGLPKMSPPPNSVVFRLPNSVVSNYVKKPDKICLVNPSDTPATPFASQIVLINISIFPSGSEDAAPKSHTIGFTLDYQDSESEL